MDFLVAGFGLGCGLGLEVGRIYLIDLELGSTFGFGLGDWGIHLWSHEESNGIE